MLSRSNDAASTGRGARRRNRNGCLIRWRLIRRHHSADSRNSLELGDHRVIPGHEVLAIGQPIRAAVPCLHASDEVVGVRKTVEVLPGPESGADFRLHAEAGRQRGRVDDRNAGEPLKGCVAVPARPLRAAPADKGRSVGRARPVAHTSAVDVVEGMFLPARRLSILGDHCRRILEPVRPDLGHPRRGIIDVLGQVRNREPGALVLNIGEEERQPIAGGIDAGLGQQFLFGDKSLDDGGRGTREDRLHRLFREFDRHLSIPHAQGTAGHKGCDGHDLSP